MDINSFLPARDLRLRPPESMRPMRATEKRGTRVMFYACFDRIARLYLSRREFISTNSAGRTTAAMNRVEPTSTTSLFVRCGGDLPCSCLVHRRSSDTDWLIERTLYTRRSSRRVTCVFTFRWSVGRPEFDSSSS